MKVIISFYESKDPNFDGTTTHADNHTLHFDNYFFSESGIRQSICMLIKHYVFYANKGQGRVLGNTKTTYRTGHKPFKPLLFIHSSQISRDLRRKLIEQITCLLYPEQKDVFFFSNLYTTELTDRRFKSAVTHLIMNGVYINIYYQ